jgi:DNA-binding GntR family transcriptional regulator
MRRRDPVAAREQMRAHLLTGREHLMKAILGLPTLRDVNIG